MGSRRAGGYAPPSGLRRAGRFLLDNKWWWIAPIGLVLAMLLALALLSGTGAVPLIYRLL
jgi:hypothetical protein